MSARPARVGLMIPSSNTMMEVDFARDLPPGTALHTARMFMEDTTPEGEDRDAGRVRAACRPRPGHGAARRRRVRLHQRRRAARQRLRRASCASGSASWPVRRSISTIGAVRAAIQASGAASIGVITPYVDELNEKIRASIEADGMHGGRHPRARHHRATSTIAEVGPDEIVAFAERALGPLAAEASIELVFASCTNFGAMDAPEPAIAGRLGVPVVTSNQAVLAAAGRPGCQRWPLMVRAGLRVRRLAGSYDEAVRLLADGGDEAKILRRRPEPDADDEPPARPPRAAHRRQRRGRAGRSSVTGGMLVLPALTRHRVPARALDLVAPALPAARRGGLARRQRPRAPPRHDRRQPGARGPDIGDRQLRAGHRRAGQSPVAPAASVRCP